MPTSSSNDAGGLELLPPDYDDDACKICGGYGVITYDVSINDPRFGKPFPCPRCGEETQRDLRRQTLRRLSNLDAYTDKTFDSFETKLDGLTDAQQRGLNWAKEWSMEFAAKRDGWLLLQGRYGCGKTHLAAAVANACVENGIAALFMTTPDLLDHLRSTFGPSSEVPYDKLYDRVANVPVLILDDLGAENASPWALEKLYQVINHRYSYRLTTVVTTNRDLDTIEPRIRSRLVDQNLTRSIKIDAPDYRRAGSGQSENPLTNLQHYADMRFDTWDTREDLPKAHYDRLRKTYESAAHYAENPSGWLVIMGTYGCGKTHLAAAVANHRQLQGEEAVFVTTPDLLDHLRATFNSDSNVTYDRLFNDIRNAPLLVLDDLGVENASPWAREKLFQVIDHRYRARLATVFTMSRTLEEVDERLASRMGDPSRSRLLAITAPSYRGKKPPEGGGQRKRPPQRRY